MGIEVKNIRKIFLVQLQHHQDILHMVGEVLLI